MVLGKRLGFGTEPMEPHNVPYIVLGAGLLWFGWFGFNAGSALGANGLAASALVGDQHRRGDGGLTWMTVSWLRARAPQRARRRPRGGGRAGGHHPGRRVRRTRLPPS